jgi:hypothetical protein
MAEQGFPTRWPLYLSCPVFRVPRSRDLMPEIFQRRGHPGNLWISLELGFEHIAK